MAQNLLEIDSHNFQIEVIDSDIPVLVDFWAEWCMPCKMISPIIDDLSTDYKGKVRFAKVNVDNNTELATELQILSIPLLILFRNGKEITRILGANTKAYIQKEIDKALQSS